MGLTLRDKVMATLRDKVMATGYAHNPNQLFSSGFEEHQVIDGRACQNVTLRSMDLLLASSCAVLLCEGKHTGSLKAFQS